MIIALAGRRIEAPGVETRRSLQETLSSFGGGCVSCYDRSMRRPSQIGLLDSLAVLAGVAHERLGGAVRRERKRNCKDLSRYVRKTGSARRWLCDSEIDSLLPIAMKLKHCARK
jgi:hypothetical protein